MANLKFERLEEYFNNLKQLNNELKSFYLHRGDGRLGKVVAIITKGEQGTISPKSNYMNHESMMEYLNGFIHAKTLIQK